MVFIQPIKSELNRTESAFLCELLCVVIVYLSRVFFWYPLNKNGRNEWYFSWVHLITVQRHFDNNKYCGGGNGGSWTELLKTNFSNQNEISLAKKTTHTFQPNLNGLWSRVSTLGYLHAINKTGDWVFHDMFWFLLLLFYSLSTHRCKQFNHICAQIYNSMDSSNAIFKI